ncbi:MAG: hypothetical protein AAFV07_02080 [Bacteroidota bacterium]
MRIERKQVPEKSVQSIQSVTICDPVSFSPMVNLPRHLYLRSMALVFVHSCPHCGTPQVMPLAQRCQSCGLNMMSDRSFAAWEQQLQPAWEQLQKAAGTDTPADVDWAEIQPAIATLTPWVEEFPGLKTGLEVIQPALQSWLAARQRKQRLLLHGFLWVVLALVPLFAALFGAPVSMVLLLCLPVLGWAWLGIWPLWKQRGAGLIVLLLLSQGLLAAQESSVERYQAALKELAGQVQEPVKTLAGLRSAEDYGLFKVDTSVSKGLVLAPAQAIYQRLGKDQYERKLVAGARWGDSTRLEVIRLDTLTLEQVKDMRAASPSDLQGLDPRPWARWGRPGVLVGGSILAVLSLFYARSAGS